MIYRRKELIRLVLGSIVTIGHWHLTTTNNRQYQASTAIKSMEATSLSFVGKSSCYMYYCSVVMNIKWHDILVYPVMHFCSIYAFKIEVLSQRHQAHSW